MKKRNKLPKKVFKTRANTLKRNKKYKPKAVVLNPINYFMGGLKRIEEGHLVELNSKNHAAMLCICNGTGTKEHFDQLTGMQNMALVLTEMHFDNQYLQLLYAGRDALHSLGQRYLKHQKFILTGEEMQKINNVLEIHEAQLEALRIIDIERAYDEIQRRLKHGINVQKIKVAA